MQIELLRICDLTNLAWGKNCEDVYDAVPLNKEVQRQDSGTGESVIEELFDEDDDVMDDASDEEEDDDFMEEDEEMDEGISVDDEDEVCEAVKNGISDTVDYLIDSDSGIQEDDAQYHTVPAPYAAAFSEYFPDSEDE